MGWSDCGVDSKGRPIGYAHEATCDHPGCDVKINRGLSYACGGMHGNDTAPASDQFVCEGYFCSTHRTLIETTDGIVLSVCYDCAAEIEQLEDHE